MSRKRVSKKILNKFIDEVFSDAESQAFTEKIIRRMRKEGKHETNKKNHNPLLG